MPSVASTLATGFAPHRPDLADSYRAAGVFDDRPLWSALAARAVSNPTDPAVTDGATGTTLTYRGLLDASDRRAAGFATAGLRPGDRVILQLHNSAEFAVTFFGLLRAGLVPVMTLPAHRITEIAHLAAGSGARAYVCDDIRGGFDYRDLAADLRSRVPAVEHIFVTGDAGSFRPLPEDSGDWHPPAVDADLPALFLVSGGTTGLPKLIARTHNDYAFNAVTSAAIAELTASDVYLAALPAAHNFPLCCPGLLGMIGVGGHTVFTQDPSPDSAFDVIERYRVTVTALVPALAQLWCAATEWEPADISSLRLLQVGGSKLAAPDAAAIDAAMGPVVQQVFGMAEGLICYTRLDDPRDLVHVSQGAPMSPLDEVRIVDEDGAPVPDGEEGELQVRGPYTIRGYYRAPEHNLRSFTDDGFYASGDLVRRLPSGHLAVTGRIKDTIVRAGENVAADDVEEHLLAHPAIAHAAVIGLPDDALGELICAVVVPGRDTTAPSLPDVRSFLADRGLASFKLPDRFHAIDELPVTSVGKIDKAALRTDLASPSRVD
ncbi:(2,3-dihydroxybenzoyl)adenylate synthase [Gordonia neofelifaecis]|uniref:AMP-dependent synthetase and ligase n=1 Tax=Gordonia neofelifaecis NRRL B-59395 TaxID=644548 RepID=F1YJM6_9ACTN|nr:AMP-binding protein [Gordonia neofelifaecis]EGD54958.1 AMP-dependent synthetase and ligase [Gordonia neofelifaecis NRRL B-59395]